MCLEPNIWGVGDVITARFLNFTVSDIFDFSKLSAKYFENDQLSTLKRVAGTPVKYGLCLFHITDVLIRLDDV